MLVSLQWLRDYVNVELSPEELADRLTMAGLEVEAISTIESGFSGVVAAKILSIKPHPHADQLTICEISTGQRSVAVVCGARNIREGDTVPLATEGAVIAGGRTIRSARIKGIESVGMLCSEQDIGMGDDNAGVMILGEGLEPGTDLRDIFDLNDTVFDISITPNRSDCLSVIGIAREIGAITGSAVHYPEILVAEAEEDVHAVASVEIMDADLCPRYTARVIKNVTIKPSPLWMRLRLQHAGLRPINNIVDVTNYVLMEYGQPLHAFDFDFLEEGRIVVRRGREREPFVSLDEKERTVTTDTLMICDGVKPVAIGGVMGGMNSEVRESTRTILLESAYFDPSSIRRTSRRMGISTDASFRFERGVDPEGVTRALNRAAQLIARLSEGAKVCSAYIDAYPRKIRKTDVIVLRTAKVNSVLGTEIESATVEDVLCRLGMEVEKAGEGEYRVTPPSFRVDVGREIDLVEEISRIYGYENIPLSFPAVAGATEGVEKKRQILERIKNILNGCGYSEVINYSFSSPRSAETLGLSKDDERRGFVCLRSPLSEEMSVMRTSLVYGLLEVMRKNVNVGNEDLRLFEIGKIYLAAGKGQLPLEEEKVGGLLAGARLGELWGTGNDAVDFYDLKGCLQNLLNFLRINGISYQNVSGIPFLHPGRACTVSVGNKSIGYAGEIHPDIIQKMELRDRAIVFELDLAPLVELSLAGEKNQYQEIPRYPSISRDAAFIVDHTLEYYRLSMSVPERYKEGILEDVHVFDVYSGKGIPEGKKSMALRFVYRSRERTLTDEEVNTVHNSIVQEIVSATGSKLRA